MDPTLQFFVVTATKLSLPLLFFTQNNHFSNLLPRSETMFSPPNDHVHILDLVTRSDGDSFDSWEPLSFATQNHDHQFRPDHMGANHQSGVSSPPLWQNSPPHHHRSNYRAMTPTLRAEAIARGQWELMEMVKNMPESCYELSLKDLVEQPRITPESQEQSLIKDEDSTQQLPVVQQFKERVKRQESSKNKTNTNDKKTCKIARSGSMDNRGLFLKMVFPISIRSKKKKNSGNVGKTLAKVSPKPEGSEKSTKSSVVDKDWWKKRSWGSRESDSSNTSSCFSSDGSSTSNRSNSNSSTNRRRGFLTSCWSIFNFKKSKSAE